MTKKGGKSSNKETKKSKSSSSSSKKGKDKSKSSSTKKSKHEVFESKQDALRRAAELKDAQAASFNELVDKILPPNNYSDIERPTQASVVALAARKGITRLSKPIKPRDDKQKEIDKKLIKSDENKSIDPFREVHEISQSEMISRRIVNNIDRDIERVAKMAQARRQTCSQISHQVVAAAFPQYAGILKDPRPKRKTEGEKSEKGEKKGEKKDDEEKDKPKSGKKGNKTDKKGADAEETKGAEASQAPAASSEDADGDADADMSSKGSKRGRKRKAPASSDDADENGEDGATASNSRSGRASKRAKTAAGAAAVTASVD